MLVLHSSSAAAHPQEPDLQNPLSTRDTTRENFDSVAPAWCFPLILDGIPLPLEATSNVS